MTMLEKAIDHYHYGVTHDIFSEPVTSYANLAIEALKKQTPKKPNKLIDIFLIKDGWTYACPTCYCACGENKYHSDVTKDEYYCTQCGQALDWSEC